MSDVALLDEHGHRIPEGLQAKVCGANRDFRLYQPKLKAEVNYADRIMRLHECLGVDTGITAGQFKVETERLLALIRDDFRIAKITNGVWLPLILPQLEIKDLGTALEWCLKGVGNSYGKAFSDRSFNNYRKGTLAGEVNIVDGSRHEQLVERMRQGPVMGIYFPNPLQRFSIRASWEQMETLSNEFILSGLDIAIAMVTYADILARDWNTLGLDMAALSRRSADYSLFFGTRDDGLDFGSTGRLARASNHYSGGLLLLG